MASRTGFKKKALGKRRAAEETLLIKSGCLGPLCGPLELDVRPLTVLIGRQGTGKSLVAQMLYLFRALPHLAWLDASELRRGSSKMRTPERAIRRIVDGLRSSYRSFATLTKPNLTIEWSGQISSLPGEVARRTLGFNAQHATRAILPRKPMVTFAAEGRARRKAYPGAVFIPTERLFYTMALGASDVRFVGAPRILEVFALWLDWAGRVHDSWPERQADTAEGEWVRQHLRESLAGEARRVGDGWKWTFKTNDGARVIDLDMASSGQRANWPLSLLPQVLFSLREREEITAPFTVFVEEPEIHLHPAAERAVVEVLAYLVNQGFRVVVTTHSLTVLYTLNNLIAASKLKEAPAGGQAPPRECWLSPSSVAAYLLTEEGTVQPLLDPEGGMIDESNLGRVADHLATQMNFIQSTAHQQEASRGSAR